MPLILLTLGCSSQNEEQPSTNEASTFEGTKQGGAGEENYGQSTLYALVEANAEDFSKAAANKDIGFSMGKDDARKVNGVINLKISGKWKPLEVFRDTLLNTNHPKTREYRYLGRNKDINKYLVAGTSYKDYQTYLVDIDTGEIMATTWTEPIVSPDKRYLANVSLPTAMEPSPNGIQVWKVAEQGRTKTIEQYIEIEQQEWEPFEMYWESSRFIIIKMIPMKKYALLQGEPKQDDFSYLRLTIK